jgi:putative transposase
VAEWHRRELQQEFRDECLSMEWFRSRPEATAIIESWRKHYNEVDPHSSLGYLTPLKFKTLHQQSAPNPGGEAIL